MNIRKLSIVLLAGIAMLVMAIEPSLAAQRKHRAYDAYASGAAADRSGAYYFGPNSRGYDAYASGAALGSGPARSEALTPAQHTYDRYNYGQNLPYPDLTALPIAGSTRKKTPAAMPGFSLSKRAVGRTGCPAIGERSDAVLAPAMRGA